MIDGRVLDEASRLAADFELELPDAVILAAVLADAGGQPSQSVFLNRNTKDFNDPEVKARLERVTCELIGSFEGGLARVTYGRGDVEATRPLR